MSVRRRSREFFDRRPLLSIFVLAILIQSVFLALLPASYKANDNTDYVNHYQPIAESVLDGRGLRERDGSAAIRVTPGYPLVLVPIFALSAATGLGRFGLINVLNLVVMAASALFVFLIARELFNRRTAVVAAALWITYPLNLWLTKQPNSEVPFILALYIAVYMFVYALRRDQRVMAMAFGAGVLTGIASLVRPAAILVAGAFVVGGLLWKGRRRFLPRVVMCGVLVAGNIIAVTPWEVWAYSATGRVLPLSSASRTQLATSIVPPGGAEAGTAVPSDVDALIDRARSRKSSLGSFGGIASFLWEEARDRPVAVVKLLALKALWPWYVTFSGRLDWLIAIAQLPYIALAIVGGVLAFRRGGDQRNASIVILAIVVYSWAVAFATTPRVRYMVPALGLLLILGGRALAALGARGRKTLGDAPYPLQT